MNPISSDLETEFPFSSINTCPTEPLGRIIDPSYKSDKTHSSLFVSYTIFSSTRSSRNKTKKSKALTTLLFLSYPYFSLLKKKRVINIASLSLSALSTPEATETSSQPSEDISFNLDLIIASFVAILLNLIPATL